MRLVVLNELDDFRPGALYLDSISLLRPREVRMKTVLRPCSSRNRGPAERPADRNSPWERQRILGLLRREIDFIPHA
jgi:hypothetical protein